MSSRTAQIVGFIRQQCRRHFQQPRPAPSNQVTRSIQKAARAHFHGLEDEYSTPGSRLKIDLYDSREKVAHELMFGDGSEIFKNIIKALTLGCSELIVYARPYPHRSMSGYGYAKNQLENIAGKLPLKVTLIDFMQE